MNPRLVSAAVAACALSLPACAPDRAASASTQSALDSQDGRYVQRNLVSDGAIPAEHVDPNLVNSWGITHRGASPWWVADNGPGLATLYDGNGVAQFGNPPLVVSVTGASGPAAPDGIAANLSATSFMVASGGASGPAFFIFSSEDGTISGWNPNVPPPAPPATRSTRTVVMVNDSSSDPLGGAVYKGVTLASTAGGDRLYATDFRGGKVDVFDAGWAPVATAGGFRDPSLPAGYAPFGIRNLGGTILVTYALQDAARHDDVAGKHHGFVDAFTTDGVLLRRVASGGKLDSPWGLAMAPASGFGPAGGMLLVGNFGDGHIVAFTGAGGDDEGEYLTARGGRITIDGLWGLDFGNGAAAGPTTTLFFAAGPNGEADGLFGRIDFVAGD